MGPLLFPLPVLAIVLAALDALLVRLGEPWRQGDIRIFFHSYFLWACFGGLALLPARRTLRFLDARSRPWPSPGYDARPWIVLLGWMLLPVAAVATLDENTSLVGLSGLAALGPWLQLGGTLLGGLALLAMLGRFLGSIPGLRTATVFVALGLGLGFLVPSTPALPVAEGAQDRPNLLLLVWDTCRADKLEPYDHARGTTPGLTQLAEQALVFEDVLSASTFTFTSHLSMLTGVSPPTHGAHLLDMRFDPARASSLATLLSRNGYRSGAFVGTDVLAGRTGMSAGFEVYDDQVDPSVCDTYAWRCVHAVQALAARFVPALRFNGRPHWIQDFQRPGEEVLDHALSWIRREDPRPWFCFVNLYDVHWPYVPEGEGRERLVEPYDGPVDGYLFRSDHWKPGYRMNEADRRHVNELYEGEIFDLDAIVARFLARLELQRGGTAVLVTSDHGEGLGEGAPGAEIWNHDDLREPQVRVPLLLRTPEAESRRGRVSTPASGIDVAPTLLALAGLPIPPEMEGHDLLSLALAPERERWVDDHDHLRPEDFHCALYRGPYKLVRFGQGDTASYELYDLVRDPSGFTDVQGEHPELLAELVTRMAERMGTQATRAVGASASDSAAALQALGYAGDE